MRRWLALLAMLVGVLGAGGAAACTMIVPLPREGETSEQAWRRMHMEEQVQLIAQSDTVFLARARPDKRPSKARLTTEATLLGRKPPRRTFVRTNPTCGGGEAPPSGHVVVFAAQIGIWDDFWRPWRWGRWVVLDWREEHEIVEPRLLAGMKERRA